MSRLLVGHHIQLRESGIIFILHQLHVLYTVSQSMPAVSFYRRFEGIESHAHAAVSRTMDPDREAFPVGPGYDVAESLLCEYRRRVHFRVVRIIEIRLIEDSRMRVYNAVSVSFQSRHHHISVAVFLHQLFGFREISGLADRRINEHPDVQFSRLLHFPVQLEPFRFFLYLQLIGHIACRREAKAAVYPQRMLQHPLSQRTIYIEKHKEDRI